MKITKSQLQRIIKEELQQVMSEQQTTMAQDTARGEQRRSYQDILDDANMVGGTVPFTPGTIYAHGVAPVLAAGGAAGLGVLGAGVAGAKAIEDAAEDREYREGPAPDVAVGGIGMLSPKERAEVARLRGNFGGQAQTDTARAMLDPGRVPRGSRRQTDPGARPPIQNLAPGAFTDDELQQMQLEVDPEFARQQAALAMSAAQRGVGSSRLQGHLSANRSAQRQASMRESLINDLTEAVLAKLMK